MIRKEGASYVVRTRKGKKLGAYSTRQDAAKRLQQIEYFKHKDKPKTISKRR
jgi:hypothetical protein